MSAQSDGSDGSDVGSDGSGASAAHEARIHAVLTEFYSRVAHAPPANPTPLDSLLAGDADADGMVDQAECRHATLIALFDYFCADGLHPGAVLRKIFAVAKAINRPPWSLLTCEESGMLFGETRAAVSWRINKVFSGYLQKKGFAGFKSPFQKSEEARANYAASAKGNRNRSRGRGRKKI